MRLKSFAAAAVLLTLLARPSPVAAEAWLRSGDSVSVPAAGMGFPTVAGTLTLTETAEFSHKGEGIDNIAQYESADGELFASVYVYYVGLAHNGLAALATANAMTSGSPEVRKTRSTKAAAGGLADVAIRESYTGYRGRLASSAAFLKSGRWLIKLRLSGPDARAADIEAAMDALLAGITFGDDAAPHPAAAIEAQPCASEPAGAEALPVAEDSASAAAEALLLGTFDGASQRIAGEAAQDGPLPARVGGSFCQAGEIRVPTGTVPILRAVGTSPGGLATTELLAVTSDAGGLVEAVRLGSGRYRLLHHQIGQTALLGAYDRLPSIAQIEAILSGADHTGGAYRATVILRPGEGPRINVKTGTDVPPTT